MKRKILTGMFLFFFSSFLLLNAQWAITYGGSFGEEVHSFQQTSDGGYIVAGEIDSFGTGSNDFWILKFTSDGDIEWQKIYGGSLGEEVHSFQQTSDGGYIVAGDTRSFGAGESDIWILKLSSDGDIEWQKTYGGDKSDSASSIQQTSDGGYIVRGSIEFFEEEQWNRDIWILKLSSDGDIEWQKTYGGYKNDSASFIQQTSDGGYIVAGDTRSFGTGSTGSNDIWILKLSSDGDIEWQKTYGGYKSDSASFIQQTGDGGYIVAGDTRSFGAGENEFWILKLSSDGDIEWQKTYGESEAEWASSIQQTNDGGYIVAGYTIIYSEYGSSGRIGSSWILKLSSTGDIEWEHAYEGSDSYSASSIKQTSDGGYIVAGEAYFGESTQCDYSNSLILKLSSTGDIEWQKTYGGDYSDDYPHSIQQTSDEGYIFFGRTNSWGAYGKIWVLKLLPNGDINPRCAFIKSSNAEVLDTDIMPEDTEITPKDTEITPEDTEITPEDTEITPQDSNALVNYLCSEKCTLTLSITSGGTTDPTPGAHTYETGTEVTLKAVPSGKYEFNGWSGNIDCDKSPIKITMDGDKSIKATFYLPQPYEPGEEWGGGGKKSCFIAEAAYGSPLHPHVKTLRDFRDKYLMPNKLGREFVDLYYKYSPFVANIISKHKSLRVIVQINLTPFVVFSYSMVYLGPIVTGVILIFVFMLPFFLVMFNRIKFRQVR